MIKVNTVQFLRALKTFENLIYAREALLYRRVFAHVRKSILDGSELTSAPGQPIKSGRLYESWETRGSFETHIINFVTELWYAKYIEDNKRGAVFQSGGGAHSVKLTKAAFKVIVAFELTIVKRAVRAGSGKLGGQWRDPSSGRFV